MNASFIFNLKQPCRNRGIDFVDNHDGTVSLDGNRMATMTEAENYIEGKPRKDFR